MYAKQGYVRRAPAQTLYNNELLTFKNTFVFSGIGYCVIPVIKDCFLSTHDTLGIICYSLCFCMEFITFPLPPMSVAT